MKKIFNLNSIDKIAKEIILKINKHESSSATIAAFYGELGSGKTTITKEIAKQIGVRERVVSPTFVIMKIYKIEHKSFKKLIHIDAYRLDSSKDLLNIGWENIINDKENLIIIEWPERVKEAMSFDSINVFLSHIDDEKRLIEF